MLEVGLGRGELRREVFDLGFGGVEKLGETARGLARRRMRGGKDGPVAVGFEVREESVEVDAGAGVFRIGSGRGESLSSER